MAQLMPLPLTVSCSSKIQIGFAFLVPAHLGSPGQRAVKRVCVCVCVCLTKKFAELLPVSAKSASFSQTHRMGYFINQMSQKHVAPFLQSDVLSVVRQQVKALKANTTLKLEVKYYRNCTAI